MQKNVLLRKLGLANFLSYGPEGEGIELQALNVLIGANGSGKSNLIEAVSLLKAAPTDLAAPIRAGGGMPEWPWKGGGGSPGIDLRIEAEVSYPDAAVPLRYWFQLARLGYQLQVLDEGITPGQPGEKDDYFYLYRHGDPILKAREEPELPRGSVQGRRERRLDKNSLSSAESILSQRKDPDQYPEITYLGKVFSEISLFRECNLGRRSPLRGPQPADLPSDFLSEDGGNLGLVLNDLSNRPRVWKKLIGELRRFYENVEQVTTKIQSGTIEILFHEREFGASIPSARLSDGTLRYLCLLAILCHPSPPPLLCIEDPEVGLHPDALRFVAELLVETSSRTQLIVTTHSDVLVSALSSIPEAVIVCERDDYGTHLRRLQPAVLSAWLEKYSLGELWRMGETGGNP